MIDEIVMVIGFITLVGSVGAVFILSRHANLFFRDRKDEFAKRVFWVYVVDIMNALSILFYKFSGQVAGDDETYFQMDLVQLFNVSFQCLTIFLVLYTSYRLFSYYTHRLK